MKIEDLIFEFENSGTISPDIFDEIEDNGEFRLSLVEYFNENKNRAFVLELVNRMIEMRDDDDIGMSGDNILLGCYLLGKHGQVEDCLKIWEAKTIDFDTFCYIDVQLVPFAGLNETIHFLKNDNSEEAFSALEYITDCIETGDFNNLDNFYKPLPWFV